MGKMFMAATNYLPAQVSDMMNQDRAFATVRLNFSGQRNICTLSTYVRTSAFSPPHQLAESARHRTQLDYFLMWHTNCYLGRQRRGGNSLRKVHLLCRGYLPQSSRRCGRQRLKHRRGPLHSTSLTLDDHFGYVYTQIHIDLVKPVQGPAWTLLLQFQSSFLRFLS